MVYIREGIKVVESNIEIDYEEYLMLEIQGNNSVKAIIGVLYRSPNSPPGNNLNLFKLLNTVVALYKCKILLLGDFNLPNIDWESVTVIDKGTEEIRRVGSDMINWLLDNCLTQHISEPTIVQFHVNWKRQTGNSFCLIKLLKIHGNVLRSLLPN